MINRYIYIYIWTNFSIALAIQASSGLFEWKIKCNEVL